ncbi:hypothetical protein P154DRAFT_577726 [Amniculicola lignicola CBS 123094]|uniref:Uncharacterized protein n=1 Tax=Amniculicola lignicola CBS 123094 TaxID=1392246 RepID=A0A6A5WER4_9PLEO|nr:hypothetical protein P154DRAFT_577726 [Amniculicola lignicola CBS 123094]
MREPLIEDCRMMTYYLWRPLGGGEGWETHRGQGTRTTDEGLRSYQKGQASRCPGARAGRRRQDSTHHGARAAGYAAVLCPLFPGPAVHRSIATASRRGPCRSAHFPFRRRQDAELPRPIKERDATAWHSTWLGRPSAIQGDVWLRLCRRVACRWVAAKVWQVGGVFGGRQTHAQHRALPGPPWLARQPGPDGTGRTEGVGGSWRVQRPSGLNSEVPHTRSPTAGKTRRTRRTRYLEQLPMAGSIPGGSGSAARGDQGLPAHQSYICGACIRQGLRKRLARVVCLRCGSTSLGQRSSSFTATPRTVQTAVACNHGPRACSSSTRPREIALPASIQHPARALGRALSITSERLCTETTTPKASHSPWLHFSLVVAGSPRVPYGVMVHYAISRSAAVEHDDLSGLFVARSHGQGTARTSSPLSLTSTAARIARDSLRALWTMCWSSAQAESAATWAQRARQ